jgi:hypothetical protein
LLVPRWKKSGHIKGATAIFCAINPILIPMIDNLC